MITEKILTEAEHIFTDAFKMEPAFISKAPGRINIIGEHTDYNFGLSMPCAINRWILVSFSPRNDNRIQVISHDFYEQMDIAMDGPYTPESDWKKYVYGCIQIISTLKKPGHGFNAYIQGNVPVGSGVSSSAALEVAFMNGLNELYNLQLDKLTIIKLCQRVEHEYLQVKSGLLDQYASQFSKANNFLVLDFQQMSHRYVSAALENHCWILCNSMVARTLAGSKYTERVEETQQALKELKMIFPEIRNFRDIQETHITALKNSIHQKRIRHYVLENKRVEDAIFALQKNDLTRFGALLSASHISLRDLYEVSCTEIDFLMEQAVMIPYCLGSRLMGGGFGGCTINLVEKDKAEEFSMHIKSVYKKEFNRIAEINEYHSVDGASIILV